MQKKQKPKQRAKGAKPSNPKTSEGEVPVPVASITDGMKRIFVIGQITNISQVRDVNTQSGPMQVADTVLKDASGTVTLTLWNEAIAKVNVGSKVQVENGYASAYKGKVQLNVGKYGKLTVLP